MADFNLPGGETPDEGELSMESPPELAGDDSRLGIKHLLVWTALCAVYLAFMRWFGTQSEGIQLQRGWQISVVMNSLNNGAMLAVPLLWWARRYSKPRFPTHPGDWIWTIHGLTTLPWLAWIAVYALLLAWKGNEFFDWSNFVWIFGAMYCWTILLFGYAVFRLKRPVRWRVFLMVCGLLEIASGCLQFLPIESFLLDAGVIPWQMFIQGSLRILPGVFAMGLAVWDWRGNEKYPWTHWVGVAIVIWGIFTSGVQIALEWAATRNAL